MTAGPHTDQTAGAVGTGSRSTGHHSLDAHKSFGDVEPWQVLDADADIVTVWDKYEEVFYGDYHPASSTYRR